MTQQKTSAGCLDNPYTIYTVDHFICLNNDGLFQRLELMDVCAES